LYIEAEEAL